MSVQSTDSLNIPAISKAIPSFLLREAIAQQKKGEQDLILALPKKHHLLFSIMPHQILNQVIPAQKSTCATCPKFKD